jgi:hypothetical protein
LPFIDKVAPGIDSSHKVAVADAVVAESKFGGNSPELWLTQIDLQITDDVYKS